MQISVSFFEYGTIYPLIPEYEPKLWKPESENYTTNQDWPSLSLPGFNCSIIFVAFPAQTLLSYFKTASFL
ncbi:hypothetical protein A8C56_07380 [Niabella ginsenosidivorans]|uniref:Uncharacterized protein n=1 Tax=Niabella ginsenosidivorans TaxID=1176587 RepID=A0A1A9I2L7_9BACT|nr:hypothetical protein A8C56_07380 [Niabella ginsenosidivorans]